MSIIFTIWWIQSVTIALATFICIFKIGLKQSQTPEKKYILPFCILDLTAIILLNLPYYFPSFGAAIKLITGAFALCELILLPFYILDTMGKPKNLLTPIILFLCIVPLSTHYFKSYNEFTFLITNLFVGYYVFKYIIWLFEVRAIKNLKQSQQYYIIQGIAICYIGSTPYFIGSFISHFFADQSIKEAILNFQYTIFVTLNICMFILFIKAFLMPSKTYYIDRLDIDNHKNGK